MHTGGHSPAARDLADADTDVPTRVRPICVVREYFAGVGDGRTVRTPPMKRVRKETAIHQPDTGSTRATGSARAGQRAARAHSRVGSPWVCARSRTRCRPRWPSWRAQDTCATNAPRSRCRSRPMPRCQRRGRRRWGSFAACSAACRPASTTPPPKRYRPLGDAEWLVLLLDGKTFAADQMLGASDQLTNMSDELRADVDRSLLVIRSGT